MISDLIGGLHTKTKPPTYFPTATVPAFISPPFGFAKFGQTFCPPKYLGMRSVGPSDTSDVYAPVAVTAGRLSL